jgi:serine/threonine protein kinase/tetratricopeptide (TPR) repeat protein
MNDPRLKTVEELSEIDPARERPTLIDPPAGPAHDTVGNTPAPLPRDPAQTLPPVEWQDCFAASRQTDVSTDGAQWTESSAPQIPGFEILSELGRGGMGVVYHARQTNLNRSVALKMLVAGKFADAALLGRFRLEADAVARLNHPHIVQIYEVGQVEGQPYFSLEYVPGGSLSSRIDREPQAPEFSARLIATLAEAVQYAHEQGIVHRDLKPANVLLAADGTPKITDFGLAKLATSESNYTRTGDIMGTPSYMAPEQASGVTKQIGPACDIYALGAMLYEMLTGRPPFQGSEPLETVMLVLSDDPVAPRRLVPRVPRDLETICLKCLEKSPRRRYGTAGELAADLYRFLAGAPIVARPVSLVERAGKWARRRPALAALWTVVFLSVTTLLLGSWWYQTRLAANQIRLATALAHSDASLGDALNVVDRLLSDVAVEKLNPIPQSQQLSRQLLAEALRFCLGFLKRHPDSNPVRLQAGRAYRQVADIQQLLGDAPAAVAAYAQSIALLTPLTIEPEVRAGALRELAAALNNQANLSERQGNLSLARQQYEQAEQLLVTLTQLNLTDAESTAENVRRLAACRSNLGANLLSGGNATAAREKLEQSVAVLEQLAKDQPSLVAAQADLIAAQANLGSLERELGQYDSAVARLASAERLSQVLPEDLRARIEQRYAAALVTNNLGTALEAEGNDAAAEAQFRAALRQLDTLLADRPGDVAWLRGWGDARFNLAGLLIRQNRAEEALPLVQGTYDRFNALLQQDARDAVVRRGAALATYQLAMIDEQRGERRQAEDQLHSAYRQLAQLTGEQADRPQAYSDAALVAEAIAQREHQGGRPGAARSSYFEIVKLRERAAELDPTSVAARVALRRTYEAFGRVLIELGEPGEAAAIAEKLAALPTYSGSVKLAAANLLSSCVPLVIGAKGNDASPVAGESLAQYCAKRAEELRAEAEQAAEAEAALAK